MKKTAFTIVELIIVVGILGIMFLITRRYFSSENQIYYKGEGCINNIYYTIKDINNAALLGRTRVLSGIYDSGADYIQTPDWYTIVFRTPGHLIDPQYPFTVEETSGLVQKLIPNPLSGWVLGVHSGNNVSSINLASWLYMYRGTGDFTKTLNTGLETYKIYYMPIRGLNYLQTVGSGGYTPMKNCNSQDFFVTYTISTPYSNVNALRVSFQNSSSTDTRKKMVLLHTQWGSGTIGDTDTWAINLQVCNNAVQCKETQRIFFDTRVNDVFLQKCNSYNITTKKCMSWQGGNIN